MTRQPEPAASPLLGPDDPPPVEVIRPDGASPFLLTCEHAGKRFPARLGTLGLEPGNIERHIAYDIGAAGVARRMSERLDAALVTQTYSRLVVDCNRWPSAHDFVTTHSEDTDIPGNADLTPAEIEARADEIFHPYHRAIAALIDARIAAARATVLVAVHSCTAVYLGVSRPWHVGILFERDRRLADVLLELLGAEADLCVGENEPYFLTDEKDYAVPVHGERRGLVHVELEIRQDLIVTEPGQIAWGDRMADVLREALGRLKERGVL